MEKERQKYHAPGSALNVAARLALPFLSALAAVLINAGVIFSMQLDFKYLDIPDFKTGEAGPLLGRVVINLPAGEKAVGARASLQIGGGGQAEPGGPQILYPGVSTALDFPVRLDKPHPQDDVLAAVLRVEVDGGLVLTRPVQVMVRDHGMYYRTYRSHLDDTVYPYALYLPPGLGQDPAQKWPLVVSLHGAYSNHANNLRRLFGIGNRPGEPDEMVYSSMPIWPELPDVPGIVVCPWGHGTLGYHGPGARDVLDVMEIVQREYSIDPERTSLTGLSMGGNGTWEFGLRYPGLWAAAFPVCAVSDFSTWGSVLHMLPPKMDGFPYAAQAMQQNQISNWALNARGMKIHIFHGNDDPVVPIAHDEMMVASLEKVGLTVPFTRFDNVGHNAWDPAYKDGRSLREMLDTRRERPFREIDFTTCRYENARCNWLEVTEFWKYGDFAVVKAAWDPQSRTVSVQSAENVALLSLDTAELLGGAAGRINVSFHGKAREFSPDKSGHVTVALKGGLLREGQTPSGQSRKRGGLEGPLIDALSDRVILVYGTGGDGGGSLKQALNFDWWGDLPDLHFIIRADTAVSEKDIAESNLVLFGDERTNSLIGRMNALLPVHFQGDKVVAGKQSFPRDAVAFKCICPDPLSPQRLVLVNYADEWDYSSGLMNIMGFKLLPDYFIYRRGAKVPYKTEVLKAGFFDKNWQW